MIDGVSQSSGPQLLYEDIAATIPLTDLSLLDNIGFTWEGQSSPGVAGPITVANFSVSDNSSSVLLGDVNRDRVWISLTSHRFTVLSLGTFQAEADVNGDGTVDFLDISPFILLLT